MTVSWNAAPRASSYAVYASQTGGAYSLLGRTASTTLTTGRLTNHSYTFEVTTLIGSTWTSGQSNPSTTRTILGSHCA